MPTLKIKKKVRRKSPKRYARVGGSIVRVKHYSGEYTKAVTPPPGWLKWARRAVWSRTPPRYVQKNKKPVPAVKTKKALKIHYREKYKAKYGKPVTIQQAVATQALKTIMAAPEDVIVVPPVNLLPPPVVAPAQKQPTAPTATATAIAALKPAVPIPILKKKTPAVVPTSLLASPPKLTKSFDPNDAEWLRLTAAAGAEAIAKAAVPLQQVVPPPIAQAAAAAGTTAASLSLHHSPMKPTAAVAAAATAERSVLEAAHVPVPPAVVQASAVASVHALTRSPQIAAAMNASFVGSFVEEAPPAPAAVIKNKGVEVWGARKRMLDDQKRGVDIWG